jgi:hypothetical protein
MQTGRLSRISNLDTVPPPQSVWAEIMVVNKQLAEHGTERQTGNRAPYVAPELKVFGPVGMLTQGGSIGNPEGGSGKLDKAPRV